VLEVDKGAATPKLLLKFISADQLAMLLQKSR
jgi:hypothetical protein